MACSGASGSPADSGSVSTMASNSAVRSASSARHADAGHRPTLAGDGGDDRELDLLVVGVEVEEQLVDLVEHLVGPGVLAVDLVEHDDGRQAGGQRLGQHVAGLGQRALGRVDEQQHAVDQRQRPLDLAAEVGVARGVDQVDAHVAPLDRGRLGQDGDAPLALLVVGVHDPVDERLVGVEHVRCARSMASTRVVLPWSTWATSARLRSLGMAGGTGGFSRVSGAAGASTTGQDVRRRVFDASGERVLGRSGGAQAIRRPEPVVFVLFAQAPRRVVVARHRAAFGARLGVALVEDRVDVEIVRVLECSGFFEAPMSPLLHGPTPSRCRVSPGQCSGSTRTWARVATIVPTTTNGHPCASLSCRSR